MAQKIYGIYTKVYEGYINAQGYTNVTMYSTIRKAQKYLQEQYEIYNLYPYEAYFTHGGNWLEIYRNGELAKEVFITQSVLE